MTWFQAWFWSAVLMAVAVWFLYLYFNPPGQAEFESVEEFEKQQAALRRITQHD
jgi:hypothetical protein